MFHTMHKQLYNLRAVKRSFIFFKKKYFDDVGNHDS